MGLIHRDSQIPDEWREPYDRAQQPERASVVDAFALCWHIHVEDLPVDRPPFRCWTTGPAWSEFSSSKSTIRLVSIPNTTRMVAVVRAHDVDSAWAIVHRSFKFNPIHRKWARKIGPDWEPKPSDTNPWWPYVTPFVGGSDDR